VSTEQLAALGAFLAGLSSGITMYFAIRSERKRGNEECEKRLAAFREGLEHK